MSNSNALSFGIADDKKARMIAFDVRALVIAGWTGRNAAALKHHIQELEKLGVPRPASTPIFYRLAGSRATTRSRIEVTGASSSGEVEFVLVCQGKKVYVGVGSDHTDRKAETFGVTLSKQMCDKPMAPILWEYDSVKDHWDKLVLRSWIAEKGKRVLYQEGGVTSMRSPEDLMRRFRKGGLRDGTIMFCGTLGAKGGVRPSSCFEFELEDTVKRRSITHAYDIVNLPVLG